MSKYLVLSARAKKRRRRIEEGGRKRADNKDQQSCHFPRKKKEFLPREHGNLRSKRRRKRG